MAPREEGWQQWWQEQQQGKGTISTDSRYKKHLPKALSSLGSREKRRGGGNHSHFCSHTPPRCDRAGWGWEERLEKVAMKAGEETSDRGRQL